MRTPVLLAVSLLVTTSALAAAPEAPPVDAVKLSEVIGKVEARPEFAFIEQIEYSDGVYQVMFYMKDGAEVRMEYDVRTGAPVTSKVEAAQPAQ